MPFPREETTPPVTKTYLVMTDLVLEIDILQETGVRDEFSQRRPVRKFVSDTSSRKIMKVGDKHYRSIWADDARGVVHIVDQARLPHVFETATIASAEAMADAIRSMRVRGAPLIGVAAAFGIALAVQRDPSDESISKASALLRTTRPTAVNLAWAIARMRERLAPVKLSERLLKAWTEAQAIADEDVALNEAIGRHGLALLEREYAARKRPVNILTHCNAGWIATVDWGTVTAPLFMAHDRGIQVHV